MSDVVRVKLPPRFYDDHKSRDLPSGVEVRRTKRHVVVDLDAAALDDLRSDADYYSDPGIVADLGEQFFGLVSSARATLRALADVELPADVEPVEPATLRRVSRYEHDVEVDGEVVGRITRTPGEGWSATTLDGEVVARAVNGGRDAADVLVAQYRSTEPTLSTEELVDYLADDFPGLAARVVLDDMNEADERRRVGRPVTEPCGTVAAYKRHLRHDEKPCEPCRSAWATFHRNRYATRKGSK